LGSTGATQLIWSFRFWGVRARKRKRLARWKLKASKMLALL